MLLLNIYIFLLATTLIHSESSVIDERNLLLQSLSHCLQSISNFTCIFLINFHTRNIFDMTIIHRKETYHTSHTSSLRGTGFMK
jgi:hypothetical protein